MSLVLVSHPENPWTQGTWRLSAEYPKELATIMASLALPGEQLYALAKSRDINSEDDPRLNSKPFPQSDGIYSAMARCALIKRLRAASSGFTEVFLVQVKA